eukprot:scaffold1308_cov76-Skeletonema_dohrnii-CCMP3373.AAC.1
MDTLLCKINTTTITTNIIAQIYYVADGRGPLGPVSHAHSAVNSEPETAPEPRDDQEGGRTSGPRDTVRQHTSPSGASLLAFQLKPEDIVGRHVLQKEAADGTRTRAKILELVKEFEGQRDSQPERVKFKARIGTSKFDKLIDYSDMCRADQRADDG